MFKNPNQIVLMYHRVMDKTSPYPYERFKSHFEFIVKNYAITLPGEKSTETQTVCLTFDDAYVDFYQYVFPLLKKHKVKALLAVPTKYILDSTNLSMEERLSVPYPQGMEGSLYMDKAPFCTWQELKEMAQSGLVKMASHSHSHLHLGKMMEGRIDSLNLPLDTLFKQEVVHSKQLLERNLQVPVDSFVYPYGDLSRTLHKKMMPYYRYIFRIGSAFNQDLENERHLIYRIDAEHYWHHNKWLSSMDIARFSRNYWLNRLKFK